MMQGMDYRRRKVIMNVRLVYGTICATATARGYSERIQSTSVDKMVADK